MKTTAAGASVLAAPAILRSNARAAGVVNVWTYTDFIPDDFKAEFEKETGIEVRIRLVDDQGKQFNLLAAEAPNPTVDIVTVAGHRFLQFIDSDLLSPLDDIAEGDDPNCCDSHHHAKRHEPLQKREQPISLLLASLNLLKDRFRLDSEGE